jgi:hypothetical protein
MLGRQLVVARCHAPTPLNLVAEPLDRIASGAVPADGCRSGDFRGMGSAAARYEENDQFAAVFLNRRRFERGGCPQGLAAVVLPVSKAAGIMQV